MPSSAFTLRSLSIALIAAGVAYPSAARADDTIAFYDSVCTEDLTSNAAEYKEMAVQGDLDIYYPFSYTLDGLAAIYEATGNELYLQKLIEFSRDIMAAGKDTVHQSGKGAGTQDGYLDYYRSEHQKWDYEETGSGHWTIMRNLARCARVGRLGPHYAAYKKDVDEITAFVAKQVIEKWEKGNNVTTIVDYVNLPSYTFNNSSHLGGLLVDAYLATCDSHYKDLATLYAEKLKGSVVLYSNGSYAWSADGAIKLPVDYTGLESQYNVQDSSHGNRVVRFAEIAYRGGISLTKSDIDHFVNTFNKNLWRNENNRINDYVNGADEGGDYGTFINEGWMTLGTFDDAIRTYMLAWTHRQDLEYFGHLANQLKMRSSGFALSCAGGEAGAAGSGGAGGSGGSAGTGGSGGVVADSGIGASDSESGADAVASDGGEFEGGSYEGLTGVNPGCACRTGARSRPGSAVTILGLGLVAAQLGRRRRRLPG